MGNATAATRAGDQRAKALAGEATTRLRGLLEAAPDAILVFDASGTILQVNRRAEILFGYDRADLIGRPRESLLPQTADPAASVSARRKDGSEFPAEVSLGQMPSDGGALAIAFVRDASEWEQERAALLLRERAAREQAERTKRTHDDLLTVVAHDLRNPLNAILLGATLIARSLGEGSLACAKTTAQRIMTLAHHMNALISDLFDVAALDEGRMRVVKDEHDVAAIVSDAVETFAPLCAEKKLTMVSHVAEGLMASCDAERVHQVLGNLVGNAIKFTPAGGTITLRADAVAGEVRFSVRDTGRGISPAATTTIFDRGGQASERDRANGLGLGLYIAKGIVEAHGGKIWVESTVGGGSTFEFTVARARVAPSTRPPARETRDE